MKNLKREIKFADRFRSGTRRSWQCAGHNEGIGVQACQECGALIAATSDGLDLRQLHSDWHDRQARS